MSTMRGMVGSVSISPPFFWPRSMGLITSIEALGSAARTRRMASDLNAALNVDDAGYGGQRFNLAAILLAAVHGTHHQYRSIGQRGAYAADGFAQLNLVFAGEEGRETAFVGAVVEDHQVGVAVAQLLRPMALVEQQRQHGDGRAIQTNAVVDHAGFPLLQRDTEDADRAFGAEFERAGSRLQLEARKAGSARRRGGGDAADGLAGGGNRDAAAIRLAEEPDFQACLGGVAQSDAAVGAGAAGEGHTTEAEQAIAQIPARAGVHLPAVAG